MLTKQFVNSLGNQSGSEFQPTLKFDFAGGAGARSTRGGVNFTLTRATAGTVKDFEGNVRNALSGEIRGAGMRRVRTMCSSNLSGGSWTTASFSGSGTQTVVTPGQLAPDGTLTAYRIQANRVGSLATDWSFVSQPIAGAVGDAVANSAWIKSNTGVTQNVALRLSSGGGSSVNATTNWQRLAYTGAMSAASESWGYGTRGTISTDVSIDITVWHPQLENLRNQSNTNPSEWIDADVDYGWGVNGVRYFAHQNGNTVSSNVVTEAMGAPFDVPALGAMKEYATTNLISQSQSSTMAGWSASAGATTGTAMTLGDLTLPLLGDTDAAGAANFLLAVDYTVDGVKGVTMFAKESTAAEFSFGILDLTAGAWRLLGTCVWGANGFPTISLTNGTYEDIEYYKDGVWRLKFFTTSVTQANNNVYAVYPAGLTAASTGTTYIGGYQTEDTNRNSSYVITAGAAAVRNEDQYSLATGPWFNATQGALFVDMAIDGTVRADETPVGFHDGSFNNVMLVQRLFSTLDKMQGAVITGGVLQAAAGARGWPTPLRTPFTCGFSYKAADFKFVQNYMEPVSAAVGLTVPTVTTLASGDGAYCYIRSISYYREYLD